MAKFSLSENSIPATLRRWARLLSKGLTIEDNVLGYEWEGEIPSWSERTITHNLGVVPTRFVVTCAEGTQSILKSGTQRADTSFFYVINADVTNDFRGKILILP